MTNKGLLAFAIATALGVLAILGLWLLGLTSACADGYVIGRFATDRTLYRNGVVDSHWPVTYHAIVKNEMGRERIVSLRDIHEASMAEFGSYYSCEDKPNQVL